MRKSKTKTDALINKFQQDVSAKMPGLQDLIIYQDNDGTYQLFNRYSIRRLSQYEYQVTAPRSSLDITFSSLKTATAWCIFDRRDRHYETRRIKELDLALSGTDVGLLMHQRLLQKAKTSDDQLIYIAKLVEDRLKKKLIQDELQGYLINSKVWQSKRYAE